ncbi:MAG: hypothetical protein JXR56_05605, partial [Candidatus Cloacimonetes bacterium]|nr:hypothetical protein [Candidatus Cloacimonadota bacterium]
MEEQYREILRRFERDYLILTQSGESEISRRLESLVHRMAETIGEVKPEIQEIPNPEARTALLCSKIDNPGLRQRFADALNCLKSGSKETQLEIVSSLLYYFDEEEINPTLIKDANTPLKLYYTKIDSEEGICFIDAENYDIITVMESPLLSPELFKSGDYLEISGWTEVSTGVYRIQREGRVILEPDFLVDVTQIATSIDRSRAFAPLFILNTLKPFHPNENIFKGSMINTMLDKLMLRPELSFNELYQQIEDEFPLEIELFKAHIPAITTELEKLHYPTLNNIAKRLESFDVLIEPNFISPKYGLKGRFDLLIIDEKLQQKHLIELKGGKAPDFGSWAGHRMQTTCYDLMLKETSGGERKGKSYILYSKVQGTDSLRKNEATLDHEQEV